MIRFLILITMFSLACNHSEDTFVLDNLLVEFEPYDGSSYLAGDFIMNLDSASSTPFDPFASNNTGNKFSPSINFRPSKNIDVISPISGVVVAVELHEKVQDGYSVRIRPKKNSQWLIGADHVINPTVEIGDQVTSGQKLGNPSVWFNDQGSVDIQVTQESGGKQLHHCPLLFMSDEASTYYMGALTQLMNDWETLNDNPNIYDQENMYLPGCMDKEIKNEDLGN